MAMVNISCQAETNGLTPEEYGNKRLQTCVVGTASGGTLSRNMHDYVAFKNILGIDPLKAGQTYSALLNANPSVIVYMNFMNSNLTDSTVVKAVFSGVFKYYVRFYAPLNLT